MKRTEKSARLPTMNRVLSIFLIVLIVTTGATLAIYVKSGIEGQFFVGPFHAEILMLEILLLLEGYLLLRL